MIKNPTEFQKHLTFRLEKFLRGKFAGELKQLDTVFEPLGRDECKSELEFQKKAQWRANTITAQVRAIEKMIERIGTEQDDFVPERKKPLEKRDKRKLTKPQKELLAQLDEIRTEKTDGAEEW